MGNNVEQDPPVERMPRARENTDFAPRPTSDLSARLSALGPPQPASLRFGAAVWAINWKGGTSSIRPSAVANFVLLRMSNTKNHSLCFQSHRDPPRLLPTTYRCIEEKLSSLVVSALQNAYFNHDERTRRISPLCEVPATSDHGPGSRDGGNDQHAAGREKHNTMGPEAL